MRITLFALVVFCSVILPAQSDLRHMQYNLTLYGNPFGCDESTNNTVAKEGWLAEIISYSQADVLCVNELADSDFYADRLLDNALNVEGQVAWARAELTDFATPSSIINGFFYRSDKFQLHSQSYINQALDGSYLLRPTDFYTIYPTPIVGDTTFITFVVVHLAASDADERSDQTEATMAEIEEHGYTNVIFSGDLNIDSSNEEAFQNLLFPADPDVVLYDPVNALGTWHNNGFFSEYHTQSTRFNDTNSGCFAPGGLDDRFDMTMVTGPLLSGENGVQYVSNSYHVLGQDGSNYNSELPTINNGDVPNDIASALYEMSDHLPVLTDYEIAMNVGLQESEQLPFRMVNPMGNEMRFYGAISEQSIVDLFDFSGRIVMSTQLTSEGSIDIKGVSPGVYLLKMTMENGAAFVKTVVKK